MDWSGGLDWWTGLVDWTGGDEKIVKKIVHCSIEKIVKKIVQDGKSALVTQGGLHVLITDTAVLLLVRVCQSTTLYYLWLEFELK